MCNSTKIDAMEFVNASEGREFVAETSTGRVSGVIETVDSDPEPQDSLDVKHRIEGSTHNDTDVTLELMSTGRIRVRRGDEYTPFTNASEFVVQ